MPYIYKITNNINGKSYIGKTMLSIEKRFKEHCRDSKKGYLNRPLYKAMNKYGIENFIIEKIEECDDSILSEREKYWINFYNSYKNGYNATLGGDGKPYLDYDLIVKTYQQLGTLKDTALKLKISEDSVHNVLTLKKIPIKPTSEMNKEKMSIKVQMIDKKTKKILYTFNSYTEAAQFLIDKNLTNCKHGTIRTHISEVCRNKRKSAAGFIWKKIE